MKTTKVTVEKVQGFKMKAEARGLSVLVDEPLESGGTNSGMTPVELMLSSLGACQTTAVMIFANIYKIDIQELKVEVEGDKDPEGLASDSIRSGYQNIRTHFYIKSNDSENRIKQLLNMVSKRGIVEDSIKNGANFKEYDLTIL